MSDAPQGEGWWQASDGRWYPPDSVPGTPPPSSPPPAFGAPTPAPGPGPQPGYGPQPGFGPPPQGGAPGYGPPPAVPQKSSSRTAWIILGSILVLLIVVCGGCGLFAYIGARDAGIDIAEIAQEAGRDFSAAVPATGPSSCQVVGFLGGESDTYTVEVTITNESGIDSHYRLDYELLGPDGSFLGSDFGVISNVPSGDEVRDTNFGFLSGTTDPADITCVVTEALRIPS